jgi:hypothetical protein
MYLPSFFLSSFAFSALLADSPSARDVSGTVGKLTALVVVAAATRSSGTDTVAK